MIFPVLQSSDLPPLWVRCGYTSIALAVLIATSVGVFALTKNRFWANFALKKKWTSRLLMAILSLFITWPTIFAVNTSLDLMPGKVSLESPFLTATAIKLGLFGLYVQQEAQNTVSPEQKNLAVCVIALSQQEAIAYQKNCGDKPDCYEHIPEMTKENMFDKIRQNQTDQKADKVAVCQNITVPKL